MPFMRGVGGLTGGGGESNPVAVPDLDGKFAAVLVRPVNLNDLMVVDGYEHLAEFNAFKRIRDPADELFVDGFALCCFLFLYHGKSFVSNFPCQSVKVQAIKPVYFERRIGSRTPLG
jgi:hypothetical protein